MEFNTVPYFESKDAAGTVYSRVPKLLFPVDRNRRTVLMQDVTMYAATALQEAVRAWLHGGSVPNGRFDKAASWSAQGVANPITFRQGAGNVPLTGYEGSVIQRFV